MVALLIAHEAGREKGAGGGGSEQTSSMRMTGNEKRKTATHSEAERGAMPNRVARKGMYMMRACRTIDRQHAPVALGARWSNRGAMREQ